jgi:hypothetical protein
VRAGSRMNDSIAMMLWATAESSGDRTAVAERGGSTDYRALRARAASVGLHLRGTAFVPTTVSPFFSSAALRRPQPSSGWLPLERSLLPGAEIRQAV